MCSGLVLWGLISYTETWRSVHKNEHDQERLSAILKQPKWRFRRPSYLWYLPNSLCFARTCDTIFLIYLQVLLFVVAMSKPRLHFFFLKNDIKNACAMVDKTAKPHVTVMQNMSRMDVKQKITTDGALSEAELFFCLMQFWHTGKTEHPQRKVKRAFSTIVQRHLIKMSASCII